MQVSVKSDKKKTVVYRTRKLQVDKFIVTEYYTDDVLSDQVWSVKGGFKKTHPEAYEPKHMNFKYYPDISFLDSDECVNLMSYDLIPNPDKILDWDAFDHLDQVLCVYLGMDGNIYRLTSPDPIPLWRRKDYVSGFSNKDYDLDQVVKTLEKRNWIKNIEIIEIPYYNRGREKTHAVEFEYKLPSEKHLGMELRKEKLFKDHYFR